MPDPSKESEEKKLEEVVAEKTGALSPDDSVKTAGERMRSADANAWPVAEGRTLVGVIDHPDPDRIAGGHGHDPATTKVGDTMTHDAPFCFEDQSASEAERVMGERNLNHLPIVDREMRIVRIVSRTEVAHAAEKSTADGEPPVTPM